ELHLSNRGSVLVEHLVLEGSGGIGLSDLLVGAIDPVPNCFAEFEGPHVRPLRVVIIGIVIMGTRGSVCVRCALPEGVVKVEPDGMIRSRRLAPDRRVVRTAAVYFNVFADPSLECGAHALVGDRIDGVLRLLLFFGMAFPGGA